MAELKLSDLPLMSEEEFTANDRFVMVDDGDGRAMSKTVFQSWISNNVQGERGEQGVAGRDGANGTNGRDGANGADGLSAYQIAVSLGYAGTQAQWITSLKGATGASGNNGFNGWSPVLKIVSRNEDNVLQVSDWVGGSGTKPSVTGYIGSSGIVTNISSAINIKGTKGDRGEKGDTGEKGESGGDGSNGRDVQALTYNPNLSLKLLFTDNSQITSDPPPSKQGWGSYKDSQYTASNPFSIAISSQSVIPNNSSEKIENLPSGVSTFYNSSSQKYLLQDTKGLYSVRVRFKVVASTTPSFINLSMSKDTTEIPFSEDKVLRGDSSVQDFTFSTEIYGDSALSTNGLSIRIKTYDRAVSVYNIEVLVAKLI